MSAILLKALAVRHQAGNGQSWVRADQLEVPDEIRRGLGSRLAALERRGLVEARHDSASFDLSRRYDVVWSLTRAGWQAFGEGDGEEAD